jgi:Domain of unknown function (DUF222)
MAASGLELIEAGIRLLAAQDPQSLPDEVLLRSTEALLTFEDQIDGIVARQMQAMHTRDTTVTECGRKLRNWLIEDQLRGDVEAGRRTMVAKALPSRPVVEAALVAGEISLEHAARIISLINASPDDLLDVIEKELVDAAHYCDPTTLARFCRELKDHLGVGEKAHDRDARQYANRWLRLTRTIDGMRRLDGMLDPTGAAIVEAALHGLSTTTDGAEDLRSLAQRRADALVAMAQHALNSADTTDHGGDPANIMVLAPLDTLRNELDHAGITSNGTLNGEPISAATIRRLACDAGMIPAILGSPSEVLDLGRRTPTWSPAQRRAMKIEADGYCRWHRCQTPIHFAQAHHINHVANHGPTDTRNGVYLCYFHHWLVHHTQWRIAKNPDGTIRIWRE